MNSLPLVSVLMTAYNREKYITEAIDSVLASSYTNFELIIVDDCSKDKTTHIAKEYENKDHRVKLYINDKNLGDYPNRNRAASYAKGKYLKYLDSDDVIYPHGIEVMVYAMEIFPEAGIGFANYWNTIQQQLPTLLNPSEAYYQHYFNKGFLFVGPSGSIYNHDFFKQVGGFNPDFGVASDFEFNLKAAQLKPVVCFHRDLFWWRPHEGQEINKRKSEYELLNNQINSFYLINPKCPLTDTKKNIANNNIKNILARRIIRLIVKFKFKKALQKKKILDISLSQLFLSTIPSSLRRKIQ